MVSSRISAIFLHLTVRLTDSLDTWIHSVTENSYFVSPTKSLETYQQPHCLKIRWFQHTGRWKTSRTGRLHNSHYPEAPCTLEGVLLTDNMKFLWFWLQKFVIFTGKKTGERYHLKLYTCCCEVFNTIWRWRISRLIQCQSKRIEHPP